MINKQLLISIITLILTINICKAQGVDLIGMSYTGQVNAVTKWNSDSTTATATSITSLNGIFVGSSTYDAYTGNYYVRGLANGTTNGVILQHNTITDSSDYTPSINNYNGGAEVDMSSGIIYTYDRDSLNNTFLNSYNTVTKLNTNLGNFNFPTNIGLLPDATCFDSNNHIYYFITVDLTTGDFKLISVPVNATTFTYTELMMSGAFITGNMGLEYSNTYDEIYMLYPSFAPNGTGTLNVATIDPATAVATPIRPLVDMLGYYFSSRTFDQNTNQLIFMAIDTNNVTNLYQYNTVADTLTIGNLPVAAIVEIECNNYSYAKGKYGFASIQDNSINLKQSLFPNPAKDFLRISNISNPTSYDVFDVTGNSVKTGLYDSTESITIQELKSGLYVFRTIDGLSLKFIKE